jgi:outer membrane protein OmpA-like peptidoglycan-associated protein
MAANTSFVRFFVVAAFLFTAGSPLAQDELRNTFFKNVDAARAEADAVDAKLLAPRSYDRGAKAYDLAEAGLARGRNVQYLRDKTAEAASHFSASTRAAGLAKTVLAQVLKSRQDAANAKAPQLSKAVWDKAQREFGAAIRFLESGNLKTAKKKDILATSLYRDAELIAIKAQYLTETRQLLADADKRKVGRYAPFTLNKAKQLLADAERELEENRYDTDYPRSLAQQANYEAKHAFYLADVVLSVRNKDLSVEMLVLQWEDPLRQIAGAADVLPAMSEGHEELTNELVAFIENTRNELQSLEQDVDAGNLRLADMEEEIRALDQKLGGATAERAALVQRLEAQARVKEQFQRVEKMFTRNEARVFREGNNVILRLIGLSFDSGESAIKQNSFDLLAKVEKAIDVFPRSELVVEGHTDSYGGDELNQKLSQDRAESLQQYMINAMRIPSYRVIATGFGETNPVANNETEAGRAKNRRIDIVIKPNLEPDVRSATIQQ